MGSSCSRFLPAKRPKSLELSKARHCHKSRDRIQPCSSLIQLCLTSLAHGTTLTEAKVNGMSHDLAQELLKVMIGLGTLDGSNLQFFKMQPPWKLCLGSYPGLRSDWLTALAGANLMVIDVSSSEIDDVALRALAGCTVLRSLHASKTDITAAGFMQLGGLTALESLVMSNCERLDGRAGAVLKHLTRLTELDLSLCTLIALCDVLPHVAGCTALCRLDVSWCHSEVTPVLADLNALQGLASLTSLNLCHARFDAASLPHLRSLSRLASLNLGNHHFDKHAPARLNARDGPHTAESEMNIVASLTRLTNLELRWCQVPDYYRWARLQNLRSLERLDVSFTKFCDRSLTSLTALTQLSFLNLDSTDISNTGLMACSALTNIDYLNLSDTRVEDVGLPRLNRLVKLKGLDLSYSFITDYGVDLLRELTSLTYLSVDSRLISDLGLKCLLPLTGLISLDIYGCKMTYAGARCVAKLPKVTWLDASGGTLCDLGVHALSEMTQLTYLSVSQNEHITDESMPSLARLTNLRSLNISGTKVTAERLALLTDLTQLTSLAMYKTCAKSAQLRKFAAHSPHLLVTGIYDPNGKQGIPRYART